MPPSGHLPPAERVVRILRLAAVLSVLTALIALGTIWSGNPPGKGHALIVAAVVLGACALVGMAILTLSYAFRQKDPNDPRS